LKSKLSEENGSVAAANKKRLSFSSELLSDDPVQTATFMLQKKKPSKTATQKLPFAGLGNISS